MAEAALRVRKDFNNDLVRRLMARPIRVDAPDEVSPRNDAAGAGADEDSPETDESADLARLRAEMRVMKAVLSAERGETAHLRARIAQMAETEPVSPEAQAVRDRWAALVDRLLDAPH